MAVDVHDGFPSSGPDHDRRNGRSSGYSHHGIYETASDPAAAPTGPVGTRRIGGEHRYRTAGFCGAAGELYFQCCNMAENAGALVAWSKCGGLLLDGHLWASREA